MVGFHRDEKSDWVAELECGHGQHVRHKPPWTNHPWVVTQEGRDARLGLSLACPACDAHDLPALLGRLRTQRGFVAHEVAEAKLGRLARWFAAAKLDAAVVGVSGGVDSALVLALLRALQTRDVLRRVVALLLPIHARGATTQDEATAHGRLVAHALGAEAWEAPLADAHAATIQSLSCASGLAFDAWSEGQALSVARTPALYGAAALLQAHGFRSIVVGTTNRDEGSYLGFFGKASDGMVDLQPIADLHKSEVRALARHFGVPDVVIAAVPRGDVHDGRSDEEMIGASYDEIEALLRLRELGVPSSLAASLRPAALTAIETLHTLNRHKYVAGNPAVFLDVLPRGVPDGWSDEALSGRAETPPPHGALPGAWAPPPLALDPIARLLPEPERLTLPGLVLRARDVLTIADCARLCDAMAASGKAAPVGVTGVTAAPIGTSPTHDTYGVGSVRATAWSEELARALWQRLAPAIPSVRFLDQHTPTDGFATTTRAGHRTWRVVGLSPLLRFMRYDAGGRHLCHYDAGFDYGDGRRSLLSVVFYLTYAPASGATRFVRDGQELLPTRDRDFSDWSKDTREDEVLVRVQPKPGDALVFDHRHCHDVERWDGPGPRIIVRGDIVYEAIPDGRAP